MSKHEKFILTSMSTILKETVLASLGIGLGIETYPLCDYIMQSTFLKMTGYQEQKMKCIAWEIATNDFEYRRRLLNNDDKLGEYSSYDSKKKIYQIICEQIQNLDINFKFNNSGINDMKKRVKKRSFDLVKGIFNNTNLVVWNQNSFNQFLKSKVIEEDQYLKNNRNLVEEKIKNEYEVLYQQRNRIAHNTLSYQQNLPDFNVLKTEKEYSRNYFLWFSILLLIDNIFIELYEIYQEGLNKQIL